GGYGSTIIGRGQSAATMIAGAELTGDGQRDLLTVDPSGTAWLYPNTGSATIPAFNTAAGPTVLSGSQTLYDGSGTVGAAPTLGLPTQTTAAASAAGTTTPWKPASRADHDNNGRVNDSWDALGNKTTTDYTPATGGPVTQVTVKNPAGWTTTTTLDPGHG